MSILPCLRRGRSRTPFRRRRRSRDRSRTRSRQGGLESGKGLYLSCIDLTGLREWSAVGWRGWSAVG